MRWLVTVLAMTVLDEGGDDGGSDGGSHTHF